MRVFASVYDRPVMRALRGKVIPIEVGAACRTSFQYTLRDDTGDNISRENPYYGELTGLYWVWKNAGIAPEEPVGFCHYGKGFWLSFPKAEKLLRQKGCDWITTRAQVIPAYPDGEILQELLKLLDQYYPLEAAAFRNIYGEDGSSNRCIAKNMFLTTGRELDAFCTFLFAVLGKLREQVGDLPLPAGRRRYCALLTERLLGTWLEANGKRVRQTDIVSDRWYVTVGKAVVNRLPFSGNSRSVTAMRRMVYHGSYRK